MHMTKNVGLSFVFVCSYCLIDLYGGMPEKVSFRVVFFRTMAYFQQWFERQKKKSREIILSM